MKINPVQGFALILLAIVLLMYAGVLPLTITGETEIGCYSSDNTYDCGIDTIVAQQFTVPQNMNKITSVWVSAQDLGPNIDIVLSSIGYPIEGSYNTISGSTVAIAFSPGYDGLAPIWIGNASVEPGSQIWVVVQNINHPPDQADEIRYDIQGGGVCNLGYLFVKRPSDSGFIAFSGDNLYFKAKFVYDDALSNPPEPGWVNGPTTGTTGEELMFWAEDFTDPDGDIWFDYKFNWGDGTMTGWGTNQPTHAYSSPGNYGIKAKARDEHGIEGDWSPPHNVLITSSGANQPPICTGVTGPTSGAPGDSLTFTATGSDPDGDTIQYQFDYGDGTISSWQSSSSTTYSFSSENDYYISAQTKDSGGLISGWCPSHIVAITEGIPPNIGQIHIHVKDYAGNRVPGSAAVIGTNTYDTSMGEILVNVPVGSHQVQVSAPGFKTATGTAESVEGDMNEYTAILGRLASDESSQWIDGQYNPDPIPGFSWWSIILAIIFLAISIIIGILAPISIGTKLGAIAIFWLTYLIIYFTGVL